MFRLFLEQNPDEKHNLWRQNVEILILLRQLAPLRIFVWIIFFVWVKAIRTEVLSIIEKQLWDGEQRYRSPTYAAGSADDEDQLRGRLGRTLRSILALLHGPGLHCRRGPPPTSARRRESQQQGKRARPQHRSSSCLRGDARLAEFAG
jgi:hypothetical protein